MTTPTTQREADERQIYVASRASVPARPQMWQSLRAQGWPISSTWIDEAGEGETGNFTELWQRIHDEIYASCGVVLYAEESDFPLKGAFIECGMALGMGKPVAVVLKFPLMDRSMRPLGSWANHPLVKLCQSLDQARKYVQSSVRAAIDQSTRQAAPEAPAAPAVNIGGCPFCGKSGDCAENCPAATDQPSAGQVDERDNLAEAIHAAAVKAGIIQSDAAVTGPQLVMLCDELAHASLTPAAPALRHVEELFSEYWDIAYREGQNGSNEEENANTVLSKLRALFVTPTAPQAASQQAAQSIDTTEFRDLLSAYVSAVMAVSEAQKGRRRALIAYINSHAPQAATTASASIDADPEFQRLAEYWRGEPYGTRSFLNAWDELVAYIDLRAALARAPLPDAPLSNAEFLAKRLGRVAKLAGVTMPGGTYEQIAEVAGTILGEIARALESRTNATGGDKE